MKDTSQVFALSLYVPNCDKKGFFKRKQVQMYQKVRVQCYFDIWQSNKVKMPQQMIGKQVLYSSLAFFTHSASHLAVAKGGSAGA